MKTPDLDGTLLNNKEKLSDFTVNTVNSLVNKGTVFTWCLRRCPEGYP